MSDYMLQADYFRADPPIGTEYAAKGTKIQCLHCHHWFVLKMPWKVSALVMALRLHRLLECPARMGEN